MGHLVRFFRINLMFKGLPSDVASARSFRDKRFLVKREVPQLSRDDEHDHWKYRIFALITRRKSSKCLTVKPGCGLHANFALMLHDSAVHAAVTPHFKARFSAIQFRYLLGNAAVSPPLRVEAPFSLPSWSCMHLFTGRHFAFGASKQHSRGASSVRAIQRRAKSPMGFSAQLHLHHHRCPCKGGSDSAVILCRVNASCEVMRFTSHVTRLIRLQSRPSRESKFTRIEEEGGQSRW